MSNQYNTRAEQVENVKRLLTDRPDAIEFLEKSSIDVMHDLVNCFTMNTETIHVNLGQYEVIHEAIDELREEGVYCGEY